MANNKMTAIENRAVMSLSTIMGLRMIGLFMVLPVFALYAHQLAGATPTLIGLAIGIYGLLQATFQIPFGVLSDHFGRKSVIAFGLLIFIIGSILSAAAHSIWLMILGRALQGAGAVGSSLLAMMADLTSEQHRTKAMAIAGITIGFSFSLAMLLGPLLTQWLPISDLFFIAAIFGIIAITLLYIFVPTPTDSRWHRDTTPELKAFKKMLINPDLARLNSGILFLHAIFTSSFIAIPLSLHQFTHLPMSQQWVFYLPTLLIALILSLIFIGLAERKQQIRPYFLSAIIMLLSAEGLLWLTPQQPIGMGIALSLFFTGFSLLEALLPSLISRTAPAARKGTALGLYSCAQFLGIFVGGALGGWLYGHFSFSGIYFFSITLALLWFVIAYRMQPPRYLITQMLPIPQQQLARDAIVTKLQLIPGIIEVTLVAEDGMAYLKMERSVIKHPDFIRLTSELQSE